MASERGALYPNPQGTLPMPAPSGMPVTLWTSEVMPIPWVGVNLAGDDTATWRSPLFDLRANLRSSQGASKIGVPVYDPTAKLYIQFFDTDLAAGTDNFRVTYAEYANSIFGRQMAAQPGLSVANPGVPNQVASFSVVRVTAYIDASSDFMLGTNQPPSVVLVFAPLGEGYPIRYWSVELSFTMEGGVGALMSFQAALY